jgi:hypothetical protein
MERNRSTASPKAAADSPRSRQKMREIGRTKRAQANESLALQNQNAGPNSKMSRKASVAKRAQQIYSGKINPKEKTKARLTKTTNPEALRKRVAKIKDNKAKPPAAPKATAKPKTGQEIMKADVRKVQNKKLRDINAEIKAAGPNAINLRVEKLALQNNMLATQPRQTAKQVAKSEKQTQLVRGRIAEMRRDRERIGRAAANRTRNADVRNSAAPMSKASFAPRPSRKTIRSQNQADKALDFYANPTKALRTVNKRKPGFRLPREMRKP